MTLRIDYNSEDFPATGPVPNGSAILMTDWNELLWSALTGRSTESTVRVPVRCRLNVRSTLSVISCTNGA
jgi:hypothetical protein